MAVQRSQSGHHALKPSMPITQEIDHDYPELHIYSRIRWTFGRGSVIRTVWKAVLLHTLFAIVVVAITMNTSFELAIPSVMLTVLGVVLGFVISYRAASGYDRYWMGRMAWSDVMKISHIMARLIWYHIPPCKTPRTAEERMAGPGEWKRPEQELLQVMTEKVMALQLLEAFSVALKHHIRGEPGLYYSDLYDLVRPLHPQSHNSSSPFTSISNLSGSSTSSITAIENLPPNQNQNKPSSGIASLNVHVPVMTVTRPSPNSPSPARRPATIEHGDLVGEQQEQATELDLDSDYDVDASGADHQGPWKSETVPRAQSFKVKSWGDTSNRSNSEHKYRPSVAGEGDNLPLEILRCLSEWCSVLEYRGTVPGTSMGSIIGCISTFEDDLSVVEKILTTPLPFVFSSHIRHTVWIFLIFLPFQLVGMFGWHSITGVLIASFIYLGFLAAGEEIEQPFGYDENDLDLDLFCRSIIHVDIEKLQNTPCPNAYFSRRQRVMTKKHRSMTIAEATTT
ncbi:Bestrophin, RFP-TM, chloride channel-domain-containing protein, partial [Rhodocollybia butyracea]